MPQVAVKHFWLNDEDWSPVDWRYTEDNQTVSAIKEGGGVTASIKGGGLAVTGRREEGLQ